MIDAIRFYNDHSVIGLVFEGTCAIVDGMSRIRAVNSVAVEIFVQILISMPLLYLHHNLFALGFAIGFVFDKHVRRVVQKVNIVFDSHRTFLERILFFFGGGIMAIYTMPTSLIIATLYYSSQWGAYLFKNSQVRYGAPQNDINININVPIQLEDDINLQLNFDDQTNTNDGGGKLEKLVLDV